MEHTGDKRMNFEELSKEELVKKCEKFLAIIQKAKQSKCLLQDEITRLKKELDEKPDVQSVIDELIQDLTQQKLVLVSNNEDLKAKNETLSKSFKQFKTEMEDKFNCIENEKIAYKKQVDRLTNENEELLNHLDALEKQIAELNRMGVEQRSQLLEIEKLKENNSDRLKEKLKNYHGKIIKLANNLKLIKNDKEIILSQFKTYTEQVNQWRNKLTMASRKLLEYVENCDKENEELRKSNQFLKEQLEITHKTDDEKSKELENTEKLQEKFEVLEDRIATLTTELASKNEHNQKTDEENAKLLEEIQTLKEDCSKLSRIIEENNSKKNIDSDTQTDKIPPNSELLTELNEELRVRGENLSKLESQCEELNRKFSALEFVIEKKEEDINVLQQQLNEKEAEVTRLKTEINENYESDMMSTSTISRNEELERLKDLEGSWEEKYGKLRVLALKLKAKLKEETKGNSEHLQKLTETNEALRLEIEELKKDKLNVDTWKKQIALKVQALRKELEEKEKLKKEHELKISKLTADLDAKEQSLKLEIESHRQTKNSLQHSANEHKKHTALSLEMQDYEKSVKDLSTKIERKEEHITKLRGQVDSQKGIIAKLKDDNKELEEKNIALESELGINLDELKQLRKNLNEFDETLRMREDEIVNLQAQTEQIKAKNEDICTELSREIAERQKLIDNLRSEKETLYLQNINLQQTTRDLQQKLSLKEQELSTYVEEYETYKVRAQSVLRQTQSRDIGLEERLNGNITSLTSQIETLTSELEELRSSNEKLQEENRKLNNETTSLSSKFEQVSVELTVLKEQYDELLKKYNKTLSEHNETVRSLKVHAETLAQCYRQQLLDQENRYNKEIAELQTKIDKIPAPFEIPNTNNLLSMPREEGEGSESIDSINLPIPLEQLLNESEDQKRDSLRKQLLEQESKLAHLTELLAETEQDLLKHVQMNKLLKDEIRRQQRAVEREKHAENLEYLKNVVFKFLTLTTGDERIRLVPVLNTILKLSPEEVQKLDLVARGDPGLKAWSSYLSIWPSSSNT